MVEEENEQLREDIQKIQSSMKTEVYIFFKNK